MYLVSCAYLGRIEKEGKAMRCNTCKAEVTIITPHEQFFFGASGLCKSCQGKVFEESYRTQDELACCRNCRHNDWVEDFGILCGINKKPVSTVGICDGFEIT